MPDDTRTATPLVAVPDRVLHSDPHDFAGLYVRHRASLTRHARRHLNDVRDADEVVQEAFLRLFLALPELDTELQALAYCRRTITNLCIDRYRADARRPNLVDLESVPQEVFADDEHGDPVVRAEDAALVRQALAMLPELHRTALIKREVEEKSLPVIADELAIPEDNVKHLLFRARRTLRKLLAATSLAPGVDVERGRGVRGVARAGSGGLAGLLVLLAIGLGSGPDLEAVPVVGVDLPDVIGVTRVAEAVAEAVTDVVARLTPGDEADPAAAGRSDSGAGELGGSTTTSQSAAATRHGAGDGSGPDAPASGPAATGAVGEPVVVRTVPGPGDAGQRPAGASVLAPVLPVGQPAPAGAVDRRPPTVTGPVGVGRGEAAPGRTGREPGTTAARPSVVAPGSERGRGTAAAASPGRAVSQRDPGPRGVAPVVQDAPRTKDVKAAAKADAAASRAEAKAAATARSQAPGVAAAKSQVATAKARAARPEAATSPAGQRQVAPAQAPQARAGQAQAAQVRAAQVRAAQAQAAQARAAQVRAAQAQAAQSQAADKAAAAAARSESKAASTAARADAAAARDQAKQARGGQNATGGEPAAPVPTADAVVGP